MLNEARSGKIFSVLAEATLAALLEITIGCGASTPAGPTPTPVTSARVTGPMLTNAPRPVVDTQAIPRKPGG